MSYLLFLVFGTKNGKMRPTTPQMTVNMTTGMNDAPMVLVFLEVEY